MTGTILPHPRSPVTVFPAFHCQVRGLLVLPRGFRTGLAETLPHGFHFDNSSMVSVITQVSIKIYSCYCSSHFPQYMCIVFGKSHNHSPHPTDAVVRATPASIYQTFLLIQDFTNNHKCCSLLKISTLSFLDCVSGKAPIRAPALHIVKVLLGFALQTLSCSKLLEIPAPSGWRADQGQQAHRPGVEMANVRGAEGCWFPSLTEFDGGGLGKGVGVGSLSRGL